MAILVIILAQFVCTHFASGVCPINKSGPGCLYACHCRNSTCDEFIDCRGPCDSGWRGRTCQQENVALRKTTRSSATYSTGHKSDKAVNGNKTSRDYTQFHTDYPGATSAWWSVDLGSQISVQEVIIYFRTDYKVRRNGLHFFHSNTQPNADDRSTWGSLCHTVISQYNGTDIADDLSLPSCIGTWRYLFIYSNTSNDNSGVILDFSEVEIYAACSPGTYGTNCSQFCDGCNSDGCDANGQCKTACTRGTYGDNCKLTCGHCNGACDSVTGKCLGTCKDGYIGDMCNVMLQTRNEPTSDYIPVIAGVIVGILVLAVIVIVIIVFKRQRVASQREIPKSTRNHPVQDFTGEERQNTGCMNDNMATVAEESPKTNETPAIRENLAVRNKPKQIRQTSKSQSKNLSDFDMDEEISDEEETVSKRDYYNVDDTVVIREVPVGELTAAIHKIKSQEGGFEAEYSRLPNGFTAPYGDSQNPENAGKNKFRGYYPYDHNRVRLLLLPDVPSSDYINASLMHSYNQKKTYIASQAPNEKTVGDFWRMIWEQQCGRVIMLTGLVEDMKAKCYQYWPDKDALQTGHYRVEVDVTDTRAHHTVRYLKVTSKQTGDCRSVVQYHFTSWPDHGVPDTLALVHFIWMIRQTDTLTNGPLLVHCSAGIGRTGTYIAVDSLLDQAREEGVVDVLGYVSVMRGQRKNMIQTKEQYECVFHSLVEMTKYGNTSMDVENFTTSYISRGMDSMIDRKTLRELTQMMIAEDRSENIDRNRMWVDGNENFMIRVGPTLRNAKGYLMAVVPPPGLEKLLWKLVEENNVHNIIVISQLEKDLIGGKVSRKKCGAVTLTTTGHTILDSDLTMMTLELHNANSKDTQNIKLFKLNGSPTLDSMSSCLLNHTHLQHLSGEITPVVIVHSETDRQWAVSFSIMGNIMSGIMEDHRVDVIGHVRTFLKCYSDLTFSEQEIQKFIDFAKASIQMTTPSNTYANL